MERLTSDTKGCEVCSLADPRVLVRRRMPVEVNDTLGWRTLCANCDVIAGKRPLTLAQLTAEVRPTGDRRITAGRTGAGDRRTGDRRGATDHWVRGR